MTDERIREILAEPWHSISDVDYWEWLESTTKDPELKRELSDRVTYAIHARDVIDDSYCPDYYD